MLELHEVSKHYEGHTVVHPLDLAVQAQRTTVLIGPSGSGKSTLIRLMIGLVRPDSGRVVFDGRALADAQLLQQRRRMGYVIQEGGLFPHLTARDNIVLMARHLRWSACAVDARVESLAGLTRFPLDALDRYPGALSGGQRQRVALMRALMLDPDLLLLDEPLGALDPMIRYDLQTELASIFRELGKTVVLVTHDMGEAAFFGDRLLLLDGGRVVQDGPPAAFLERPAGPFVRRFIRAQRRPFSAGGADARG